MKKTLFAFTVVTLMAMGCSSPQKPAEQTTSAAPTVETVDSTALKLDNAKQSIDQSVDDVKQKLNDLD